MLCLGLCLMQFNCMILHVPGKALYTADTLSHSPQKCLAPDKQLAELTEQQMTTSTTINFHHKQFGNLSANSKERSSVLTTHCIFPNKMAKQNCYHSNWANTGMLDIASLFVINCYFTKIKLWHQNGYRMTPYVWNLILRSSRNRMMSFTCIYICVLTRSICSNRRNS